MSQDHLKLQHALSRLALAKAIKTPEPNAIEAEPWSKSIIFNQPYVQQLLKQRDQMNRRDRNIDKPKLQIRRKSHSSLNIETKMSKVSIKKSMTDTSIAQHACLPSDSEDSEDEEDKEEEEEEEEKDDSELFQVNSKQRTTPYTLKTRNESFRDDISSSPSRGSASSSVFPLTDEEESIPPNKPEYWKSTIQSNHFTNNNNNNNNNNTFNNKPTSMDIIDPLYYQRMQQYQLQLQYQTQLQYQQTMLQQQQLYLQAQTPIMYLSSPSLSSLPPPPPPISTSFSHTSPRDKKQQSKRPIKATNTDIRRRAEMMKNANDFPTQQPIHYSSYTVPLHAPIMRATRNTRPNYHPI